MLGFSTPLIFSSLSAVILTVLDRYSLNYIVGLDDVGVYTTGYKIANVMLFVVMASQLALPTILFKNMESKGQQAALLKGNDIQYIYPDDHGHRNFSLQP